MRKKIEAFCNEIKEEYGLYLYNKGAELDFPYCCKLSADLITSFLKMACGDKFQYICTTREGAYNHAWTYYNDEKEEFVIDFTQFQFTNSNSSKRIKNGEVSIEEFREIINKEQVVFDADETYMYAISDIMIPREQKCYGLCEGLDVELSKRSFMRYLEKNYDFVFENTIYY